MEQEVSRAKQLRIGRSAGLEEVWKCEGSVPSPMAYPSRFLKNTTGAFFKSATGQALPCSDVTATEKSAPKGALFIFSPVWVLGH
jgi:hypothetical protein